MSDARFSAADFADIDRHFAAFVARFDDEPILKIATMGLSRAMLGGHICVDLKNATFCIDALPANARWPDLATLRAKLAKCRTVGDAHARTPLVLDDSGRLYLRRYFDYEKSLAAALRERCADGAGDSFSNQNENEDAQEIAVATALARQLCIISGGPGTGKTTTVLRILARLIEQQNLRDPRVENKRLRIALAAPTGKAAARLEDAIRDGAAALACDETVRAQLPKSASTIHRLLGAKSGSASFFHDEKNPLAVDALVIDEASMVPLPLMAKVFAALPKTARVILLGDRDQLASVEPGSVLGDLAEAASAPKSPLAKSFIVLTRNYRFGNDSGIFRLCQSVRDGDATGALKILREEKCDDLRHAELPGDFAFNAKLKTAALEGFAPALREKNPRAALETFGRFRVLCALQRGPFGVEEINRKIISILQEEKLLARNQTLCAGLPLLITENDHQLKLYNGDIGILLPDPNAAAQNHQQPPQRLWAWFPGEKNEMRRFAPGRLPPHKPAFAMTVHKSQGSEFERVLFLLPRDDSAVLSRELLYTGLTRARSRVELWCDDAIFTAAISRRAQRSSGLQARLSELSA